MYPYAPSSHSRNLNCSKRSAMLGLSGIFFYSLPLLQAHVYQYLYILEHNQFYKLLVENVKVRRAHVCVSEHCFSSIFVNLSWFCVKVWSKQRLFKERNQHPYLRPKLLTTHESCKIYIGTTFFSISLRIFNLIFSAKTKYLFYENDERNFLNHIYCMIKWVRSFAAIIRNNGGGCLHRQIAIQC